MTTAGPCSTVSIDGRGTRLVALEPADCLPLAEAIAAMPPWSVMHYPAEALARLLAAADGGARRLRVEVDGRPAGAVSVRSPWLKGPYLELLALLPLFQSCGIGSSIIGWLEADAARQGARNIWVCASSFNEQALRFYWRHGFQHAAVLPGLVADGYDEILLRKFPLPPER